MFDIGAPELLLIVIVAILVIGPKEMPRALRTAGQWIAKIRRVSGHFRSGIDAMIREADMEDMEKEWKSRNEKIMASGGGPQMEPLAGPEAEEGDPAAGTRAEDRLVPPAQKSGQDAESPAPEDPQLPLGSPQGKG